MKKDEHRETHAEKDERQGNSPAPTIDKNGVTHGSSYEEYLYGRRILSSGTFTPNWASTTKGRIAIRLVSRGIFGAAGFALGGHISRRQMQGYEPGNWDRSKPLQWVAKGMDTLVGTPIEWTAARFTSDRWAQNLVRFKPKAYFYTKVDGMPVGRSLGSEAVAITFDFSSMSLGDAIARNVIQSFDPNLPQPWLKDKNGHDTTRRQPHHFDSREWLKSIGRATWRSVTKNAGEDWFAAIPYIYYIKWQRQALSKFKSFSGFKLQADANNNGASLIIDAEGKIIGDYQTAGMLDLWGRFSVYNVFTLMFRDLYDWTGHRFKRIMAGQYHPHPHMPANPALAFIIGTGRAARYAVKSFIKASLFMVPSVPFFFVTRVSQSKWRSPLVLGGAAPNQFGMGTTKPMRPGVPFDALEQHSFTFPQAHELTWQGQGIHAGPRPSHVWFGEQRVPFPAALEGGAALYAQANNRSIAGKLFNPLGKLCYNTGSLLTRAAEPWVSAGDKSSFFGPPAMRESLLRTFVDASYSYTPYFAAKDEFGLRINDQSAGGGLGHMDKAIYRFIDDVFTLRFHDAGRAAVHIFGLGSNIKRQQVIHAEGDVAQEHIDALQREAEARKSKAPEPEAQEKAQRPHEHAAQVKTEHAHNAMKASLTTRPSTKVQATTVQYNAPPPTHLSHATPEQAAKKGDDTSWVNKLAEQHSGTEHTTQRPTIH